MTKIPAGIRIMPSNTFGSAAPEIPANSDARANSITRRQIAAEMGAIIWKVCLLLKILRNAESIGKETCECRRAVTNCQSMTEHGIFQRRGIVEGFFGPLWSMAHRRRLFEFGAARGMNTTFTRLRTILTTASAGVLPIL